MTICMVNGWLYVWIMVVLCTCDRLMSATLFLVSEYQHNSAEAVNL